MALDLQQFYGTTNFYKHPIWRGIVYTDGVDYVAKEAGAYWLIDMIAGSLMSPEYKQAAAKDVRLQQMIFYKLTTEDSKGNLSAYADSDEPNWFSHDLEYTDFPLDEIDIWACWNGQGFTLMLKTEY